MLQTFVRLVLRAILEEIVPAQEIQNLSRGVNQANQPTMNRAQVVILYTSRNISVLPATGLLSVANVA